jgi:Na+:H+ antiporter, NhaC family
MSGRCLPAGSVHSSEITDATAFVYFGRMADNHMRQLGLLASLLPILILIALLSVNVLLFGDNSLGGANQVALLLAAGMAALVAMAHGRAWKDLFDGAVSSIASALPALLILLMIGALAGTWLLSGVVPAMVYYGLGILSPGYFLVATAMVCAIVSVATGSSWSTVATVGIALLGIGRALGMEDGMVAGAIISGAYFGDKMSPLSDTTNLAPAMAGTDLITHIRHMMWTTFPSFGLALVLFALLGLFSEKADGVADVSAFQQAIISKFHITPWLFLVPLAVIGLIMARVPAAPALFIGSLMGGVFALIFQADLLAEVADTEASAAGLAYMAVINAMTTDIAIITPDERVNELLQTGGMYGMMNTIWLIICAMTFGGVMEAAGMLERIARSILRLAKSDGALVASTAGTCLTFNVTASDQYLAIVVPGRMFASEYRKRGLAPENLSRALEDSGTVTSALIPWNTCGAYHAGVLGVATGTYLPFAFFNLISPLMTILFGVMGWKMPKSGTKN